MSPALIIQRLFDWRYGASNRLIARWLFLRALGLIYFSAFYALLFQIRGLIGNDGILPATEYLEAVAHSYGPARFWFVPSLLWLSTGNAWLMAVCWIGLLASVLLVFNLWPRGMLVVCFVCFLAFVSAAGDFSGYQSDGMLLEAGFIAWFFASPGFRPGWGETHPASRASLFLLQWEWFRIYFESGVVKLASGDPQWRNWTAMDQYYQNGPLPTWIGYYVQHLPHWFHASTVFITFAVELGIVWMMFLPRRWRLICFVIVTALQAGIILTANYAFLNYLVLSLGILLLDDGYLMRVLPRSWRSKFEATAKIAAAQLPQLAQPRAEPVLSIVDAPPSPPLPQKLMPARHFSAWKLALTSVLLSWIFYSTTVQLLWMLSPRLPLPTAPVAALDPFRIANRYGLFAVMTRGRYEIEFQGSNDGQNWTPYPFRYKPQDPSKAPGIYAPYQPRFDWNLWFASLGSWRDNPIVPSTEERLLSNSHDVLQLFAGNPFASAPPKQVRAVLWQYWFTTLAEKRSTGTWWRRELMGLYAPVLQLGPDGKLQVVQWPAPLPPHG
ncbi:MAG: lipase maturation factor family protein [Candidatus Korobacteraceae bacterium]